MDSIDGKIIEILQITGKISMHALADQIPMSIPATCERVKKLEDAGVIKGYAAEIDSKKLGYSVTGYILFACNLGAVDRVRELLEKDNRAKRIEFLAGKFTMMIEFACVDMDDYLDFLNLIMPLGTSETYVKVGTIKKGIYTIPPSNC